jgi:hypothetical protein
MASNTALVQKRNKTFDHFKNFELDAGFVLEGLGNEYRARASLHYRDGDRYWKNLYLFCELCMNSINTMVL